MTSELYLFLCGTLAVAAWVAGLFFLRYWRLTRDRFFVFFTAAFWLMAVNWSAVAAFATDETRHYFYVIRLGAFLLILAAIIDKNRHHPK
jgi:hypothetical protein